MVRRMTTTTPYPNLPLPAGAIQVDPWEHDGVATYRYFRGNFWVIIRGDVPTGVHIAGFQYPDGRVERWISADGGLFTAQEGRALAHTLAAAADEVDRWAAK